MYRRILIKLSGEALASNGESGIIDHEALLNVAKVIKNIHDEGTQISIVIGAGNVCRGALVEKVGIDRVTGDKMGMLGTIINSFAMMDALKRFGLNAVVLSAVEMERFTETFSPELADKYLNSNTVVVFGGGLGKPYFSTDTCATTRAIEIKADAILIAKNNVDGVFDDDPRFNKNATMFKRIKCSEIISRDLKVMDLTAIEMLKDKDIDVRVFNMKDPDNFTRVVRGEDIGTTIVKG